MSGHEFFCRQLHFLLLLLMMVGAESAEDSFVLVVDDLFCVVHAAVTDLDGVSVKDFA